MRVDIPDSVIRMVDTYNDMSANRWSKTNRRVSSTEAQKKRVEEMGRLQYHIGDIVLSIISKKEKWLLTIK